MHKIEKIKILPDSSIKQALKTLSKTSLQILLVVNKKGILLGTLTDGDIRRGFLNGLNMNSSIRFTYFKRPTIAKKNDNKNKLLKIALSKKIYQIPVVDNKHKAIGIYIIDELITSKNKSNLVVIMAGGKGMRLRPLTKNIPKPMLKVGNKPILQNLIEKFRENGYENFILSVNYKSKIIKDYFGDGTELGVSIKYIEEKIRMGTAGSLSLLKTKPKEPFFVINGDLMINLDFEKMMHFHCENNSIATMCVRQHSISSSYGVVNLNKEKIVSIEEKPKQKCYINTGIYILDPKCTRLIPKKFYDMPTLFKKIIEKKYKAISFPLNENWIDIGKKDDYQLALNKYKEYI